MFRHHRPANCKAGVFQTRHDGFVVKPGDEMDVVNLGWRKAMELKRRVLRVSVRNSLHTIQCRSQDAIHLHQYSGAAGAIVS